MVVSEHPNPDIVSTDIVQKVVRKSLEIAAAKSASIKMKSFGIFNHACDSYLKFREEVLAKLIRNAVVPRQDFVQIRPNPPVEPNFHDGATPQQARRK